MAGLATDIELIDDIRQIISATLFGCTDGCGETGSCCVAKVRNRKGEKVVNPIHGLSKWKILDNMRRSLLSLPFTL